MHDVTVSPIKNGPISDVYHVLAQAYTHNAAHIAIFGKDNFKSNDLFFRQSMSCIEKDLFIARTDDKIIGVAGFRKHPANACAGSRPLEFTAASLEAPESVIARLRERRVIWDEMEPKEPHYHVGPVAVLPGYQGKGAGSTLMEYLCGVMDEKPLMVYLETETVANLNFYARFGFRSVYETEIFGVPAYFMKRPSRALQAPLKGEERAPAPADAGFQNHSSRKLYSQ
jgi:ribosomal protein S18 acetylase RimI-like enzyme